MIRKVTSALTSLVLCAASVANAQGFDQVRDTGVSAIWILANFAYAGMRAQDHPSVVWRLIAFFFGLPGTIITFFFVHEGEQRVYGVELAKITQ